MLFHAPPPPPPQKPITIWVHGTRGSAFLPVGISKKTQQVHDEFCHVPPGLNRASDIPMKFYQRAIASTLAEANPMEFPFESFYIFGWSGDLNPLARKKAAFDLYDPVQALVQEYKNKYHTEPRITFITHSHGGNVALNQVLAHNTHKHKITIDRLILLACPVQCDTESYIDHPLFNKVYSLYSYSDWIQILDPQKLHSINRGLKKSWRTKSLKPLKKAFKKAKLKPFFSKRHFTQQCSKLIQTNIEWDSTVPWDETDIKSFSHFQRFLRFMTRKIKKRRGLMHIEFLLPSFLKQLPGILTQLEQSNNSVMSPSIVLNNNAINHTIII